MRLTTVHRTDDQAFAPVQATFDAPGGTIGRGLENMLVLADEPGSICRVQALVRVDESGCRLLNLSGMGFVAINGQPLAPEKETALHDGDEVRIGAYVLHAQESFARTD